MNVKDLIGKKIAVHCDTEDKATKVIKVINKHLSREEDYCQDAISLIFVLFGSDIFICAENEEWEYCTEEWFLENGYEVIKFEDLEDFKQ